MCNKILYTSLELGFLRTSNKRELLYSNSGGAGEQMLGRGANAAKVPTASGVGEFLTDLSYWLKKRKKRS